MLGMENNNKSRRGRIALLLSSIMTGIASLSRKSKFRLGLAGLAAFTAVPIAALAVQGFSNSSDSNTNLNSQPAPETLAPQNETVVKEEASPAADSSSSSSAGSAQNNNSTNTQITVNGESIEVPQNGSVHKTINTNDGQVTVNVDNTTSNDNSGSSYTSTNVQSFSSSTSSNVNVNQSTSIGGTAP